MVNYLLLIVYISCKPSYREVLDSVFVGRLVNIMKTSSPNFQRKTASILEFIAFIDPSMDTIMSADIESGLDSVFRQRVLEGRNSSLCLNTEF